MGVADRCGTINHNAVGINAEGQAAAHLAASEDVWLWDNATDWSGSPVDLPDPADAVLGGASAVIPF